MDACADKALETTVLQTLHAHGFSRASSSAHSTLTDLLARYLHLLASTATRHAEHAGRTVPGAKDALAALDELGGGMEELAEFARGEGREMGRYVAGRSQKRVEDLREMGAVLSRGVVPPEEPVPLVWGPLPDGYAESEGEDAESEVEEMDVDVLPFEVYTGPGKEMARAEPTSLPTPPSPAQRGRTPSPPPLPLSPVSNPASPRPSKRQRTTHAHVPSHLPPFPSSDDVPPLSLSSEPLPTTTTNAHEAHRRERDREERIRRERSVTPPPPRHTSAAPADYTAPVPYTESTLGGLPEWHLPGPPPLPPLPASSSATAASASAALPSIQPSLLAAYHHVLTHPAPPIPPPAISPVARHRVAMNLVSLVSKGSRWDAPATLFASSQPNVPMVSAPPPSWPVPLEELEKEGGKAKVKVEDGVAAADGKEGKKAAENKAKLPPGRPRDVGGPPLGIVGLVGRQESRIPELAREALSEPVKMRTMRLTHPGPLKRASDNQDLTYGPGVPALWNAPPVPINAAKTDPASTLRGTDKEKRAERERANRALPDARVFATWEYEVKSAKEGMGVGRRAKGGSGVGVRNRRDGERAGGLGGINGGGGVNGGGVNGGGVNGGMNGGGLNGGFGPSGSGSGFFSTGTMNGFASGSGSGSGAG